MWAVTKICLLCGFPHFVHIYILVCWMIFASEMYDIFKIFKVSKKLDNIWLIFSFESHFCTYMYFCFAMVVSCCV